MNLLKYKDFHDYGLPHNKADNPTKIMENINYLYNKMQQCTRNVTYFDLYKINTVITQDSEFEAQVNALEPYSTAIINSNISTSSGTYSPGDMIVKNIDGTTINVFAQRGGIFYPKLIQKIDGDDNNYSYAISFAFQQAAPSVKSTDTDSNEDSDDTWEVDYAETLTFANLKGGAPASPYNLVYNNPTATDGIVTLTFDAAFKDDKEIYPIVHAYNNTEEIYMDQVIEYNNSAEPKSFTAKLYSTICTKVVIK